MWNNWTATRGRWSQKAAPTADDCISAAVTPANPLKILFISITDKSPLQESTCEPKNRFGFGPVMAAPEGGAPEGGAQDPRLTLLTSAAVLWPRSG